MKLVRFGPPGRERPGLWVDDAKGPGRPAILDVRAMAFDIADFDAHFFAHGGLHRLPALRDDPAPRWIDPDGIRLGPPVARPSKCLCLGQNYAEHAREFGAELPATPVVFAKAVGAIQGPFDPIALPRGARVVDGEVELALVIGRRAQGLSEDRALEAVAGYLVFNDVTDREAQRAGGQWFFGKGADTFAPIGPFLVTADAVPDPHRLRLVQRVNGHTLQDDSTANMVFRIPRILAYITSRITLEPGDLIATGTPAGIGSARTPPVLLAPGDVIETGVEGLGEQRATIRNAD